MCITASGIAAQARQRASVAAPFHKDPRGIQLGTLVAGISYTTGASNGGWTETTVEGWIWSASVSETNREGFDLNVVAGGGEVVRAEPNGTIVGRLVEGTLLNRVRTRGAWIRVRRSGWVSAASLAPSRPVAIAERSAPTPDTTRRATDTGAAGTDSTPVRVPTVPDSAARGGTPASAAGPAVTLRRGAELAAAPDGARVAVLERGGRGVLIERSGEWSKVRVEGWVRNAELGTVVEDGPRITAAMLQEAPDRYVGQPVAWRLQFLARQTADELRPEMPVGSPYLLTRGPLPETGFVYVLLTAAQAAELASLEPLDEIRIDAVIRAARTRYLPTPVVELVHVVER